MTIRVIIYIRVSTKMQEDRYSLAAQREELRQYAESQGWEIVNELKDVDSGGKLDKVGLNALMDAVEEGLTDIVLVIDQDRLSRLDTLEWEFLKGVLRDNNVKIAEPGSITDLKNEDDEFISDIKNLIAKREKRSIVRRMMWGKKQKLREGLGWGSAPFEYRHNSVTGKYEVLPEWSWIIPMTDDLYLNKQLGCRPIARKLTEVSKTPSGKAWTEDLVRKRLSSKFYHGVIEKTFATGETITVEDVHEALHLSIDPRGKKATSRKVSS
ncbi:recombinase family protein [Bacillus sp. FJAT-52991]|uniref:Recombinase family protein n=1 Tax=Bacillus kandeliae TaxID=3129297 RepID=A0ABZ2N9W7_9BACI